MNKIFSNFKAPFLASFIFFSYSLFSIDISVNNAAFQFNETKYLEIYLQVIGSTVNYIHNSDSLLEAGVDITLILEKDKQIYSYEKFSLSSPKGKDISDFISLRRFKVENGVYILKVNAIDLNDKSNIFSSEYNVNIALSDEFCISDVQLLANISKSEENGNPFVKNGYYLEPILYNFLPEKVQNLGIYFEIYNGSKASENENLVLTINNTLNEPLITKEIRIAKAKLQPVLTQIDITALESGQYKLFIKVKSNNSILKNIEFQRSNPLFISTKSVDIDTYEKSFVQNLSFDSLMYSLKAIVPLTTGEIATELNTIISGKKIDQGKFFLWRFWEMNKTLSAVDSYKEYMKYADFVDKSFRSQVGYGFETDRGYTFLKYGRPSDVITRESEPTAPPYEIWFYHEIKQNNQKNVKFIFYVPSLAHNDYELLHSTCLGETNRPDWFYILYSKRNDVNIRNMKSGQIQEFYNSLKNSFDNNAVRIWEDLN